jgi:hypothetical protein
MMKDLTREQLEERHRALLVHCDELLAASQRMAAALARRQAPEGEKEDEVAAWLKSRGWLVSKPITIEGEAI